MENEKKIKNKKAEILIGNVVFILLNAVFIFVLILFLAKQAQGVVVLEQVYAKEIALLTNGAHPGMQMLIDMEKGMKAAQKNGIDFKETVKISGNVVYVQLDPKSGYAYSFFNDVKLYAYPDQLNDGRYTGLYVLNIAPN